MPRSATRSGTRGRPTFGFGGSSGRVVRWLPTNRQRQAMQRSSTAIVPKALEVAARSKSGFSQAREPVPSAGGADQDLDRSAERLVEPTDHGEGEAAFATEHLRDPST